VRIIAGELKGRKLTAGRGLEIRPTADRVRESLFGILGQSVRQAVVLDLFAGTGALGIEALSRGAALAVFVDHSRRCLSVLHHNIRICGLESRTRSMCWDIRKNLNCLQTFPEHFSLVFIDPPYRQHLALPTLVHLDRAGCLQQGACLVAEQSHREELEDLPTGFTRVDMRRYGKTLVSFLRYML
jgi:16S rRNA (guanine966-N2)-methyltransferase